MRPVATVRWSLGPKGSRKWRSATRTASRARVARSRQGLGVGALGVAAPAQSVEDVEVAVGQVELFERLVDHALQVRGAAQEATRHL